jgi:hypothetical protein
LRPAVLARTPRRGLAAAASVVLAATALTGCGAVGTPVPGAVGAAQARSMPAEPVRTGALDRGRGGRMVVVVSLDGLTPAALTKLGRKGTPALHRMLRKGAGTLNARTAVEETRTLPNHTGMFTGRRVLTKSGHHITVNHDPGGTVHSASHAYRASMFDVVHDRGGRTALYASKDKFALFNRSWGPRNGARDRVGRDQGRDKIDRYVYRSNPGALRDLVVSDLRARRFDLVFLHVRWPDSAGHANGFMSRGYLRAVRSSDALVGRIMRTIASSRHLSRRVDLIVTADHGGARGAHSHSQSTRPSNYTIPFLVWGAHVKRGASLYALNPGRDRPGDGRPGYRNPPIRNTDVASLATRLLGHRSVPGGVLRGTRPLQVS